MIETTGQYYDTLPDGRVLIATVCPEHCTPDTLRLLWDDPESITPDQRRKIFALCGEIAVWSGHHPEFVRKSMQADFLRENMDRLQLTTLSLAAGAGCSKSTARMLLNYLICFCLAFDVPTSKPLSDCAEDLAQYTYACLVHKKCCVCGRRADLHHVDQIGMGFNRRTKAQLGALALPLCREHHSEYHTLGRDTFAELYHVEPVPIDSKIAGVYGLTEAAKRDAD